MENLRLLPRGEFEIDTHDYGTIKGRFCTWALYRFTERYKIGYADMVQKLTTGFTFEVLASFVLCAVEYKDRESKYTAEDAFEWLDDIGVLDNVNTFIAHAVAALRSKKKEGVVKEKELSGATSS